METCFFGAKDNRLLLFVVTEDFHLLGGGWPTDCQGRAQMELHQVGQ